MAELVDLVRARALGPAPGVLTVATAFSTVYGTKHAGRSHGYHNEILSLRVGSVVGSCGLEGPQRRDLSGVLDDCVGASVGDLLDHPVPAVRIAALDAYLMHVHPHPRAAGASGRPVIVDGPSSLAKSQRRARAVVDLLPAGKVGTVLVVGVVNSLLAQLRRRGLSYIACDNAGGTTEWGENIVTSTTAVTDEYDAMLVTGMTLVNGSFDALLQDAGRRGIPLVMFAQSGSAVLPWFLGERAVTAVSAEPYPFFSLDGNPSTLFHYRNGDRR
ncbi:Rossmann-like domain-containing protein [Nocardia shimofusensis]|uniref:Rossmann-like domain-containing protein n=1 Tax=Nocardia shimofusensis TaxID=228596 RepID=UPI001FE05C01|nr:DUF364 domain-containing protein [Nocardia shimofusensis]